MEYTGLDSAPKILTEEDVLRHCYGVEASPEVLEEADAALAEDGSSDILASAEPETSPEPAVVDPVEPAVVDPVEPAEPEASSEPADPAAASSVVETLLAGNTKAQLVEKATEMGLDTSGSKTALAERIAEKLAQG